MAFIPRPTNPPPSQPPPVARTFRVSNDGPSRKPWLGLLLLIIPIFFYGNDLYRSSTHTGIYREEFAGDVVSARPTVLSTMDFMFSTRRRRNSWMSSSDSSWRDNQNCGRYVIFVRDDNGREVKISVSKNTYSHTLIPSYVVGHAGSVREFPNRLAAVKAGAAERQPGDPF